jgi:hypothetical protein
MLDCLGEAIRQMLELMRRELDDVRPDHEQLRSELADVTTIFRDIRRRAGLAAERVADHLGSASARGASVRASALWLRRGSRASAVHVQTLLLVHAPLEVCSVLQAASEPGSILEN